MIDVHCAVDFAQLKTELATNTTISERSLVD